MCVRVHAASVLACVFASVLACVFASEGVRAVVWFGVFWCVCYSVYAAHVLVWF